MPSEDHEQDKKLNQSNLYEAIDKIKKTDVRQPMDLIYRPNGNTPRAGAQPEHQRPTAAIASMADQLLRQQPSNALSSLSAQEFERELKMLLQTHIEDAHACDKAFAELKSFVHQYVQAHRNR